MELKNKNRKENSKSQHDISNEKFFFVLPYTI